MAGNHNEKAVNTLVSIGTGRNLEPDPNPGTSWKLYLLYFNAAAKWAAQSETTHRTMEAFLRTRRKDRVDYYRLNVKEGLGKMKLDEWKGKGGADTIRLIKTKTEEYLNLPEVKKLLTDSAAALVLVRRARNTPPNQDRWERYCHGAQYECCIEACPREREVFRKRQDLQDHLEKYHQSEYDPRTLESCLDKGKRFPLHDINSRRDSESS